MTELEIIKWARAKTRAHSLITLGIGDDMAVVAAPSGSFLVSTDMLLDQVHFDSQVHNCDQIGRKAVARALSDCAAMAVSPVAVLVSAALPSTLPDTEIEALLESMWRCAAEFGAGVAGGDTACWNGPLAIDIAVTAKTYEGLAPVLRDGARIGDTLYTTGPLGGSILGKHLQFTPKIEDARQISMKLGKHLHAMMDISDGLALDLWRLCQASGVGAILDESLLDAAISQEAQQCARMDGKRPLEHALTDGEDYELLLAVDAAADVQGLSLIPLGRIVADGLSMRQKDGRVQTLEPRGYIH